MDGEQQLIALARAGDNEAFQSLLGPHVEPACKLAFVMLGDWQEAEDAVQEAALKSWRATKKLREGTARFRPWFFTVVANECRSRRRGRWFRTLRVAEPRISNQADVADATAGWIDLERAVATLEGSARLLLFLHFYLELPHEEAGDVLGISGAAAKTRLYRTLRALRPELELETA
ncbi:MAG TPA: RNA polymerase sigma factor [Candidatus Acidoferrum sp.]|nr:RNA polymerase sigma factor [Candidatus Acidoferrum sp.]